MSKNDSLSVQGNKGKTRDDSKPFGAPARPKSKTPKTKAAKEFPPDGETLSIQYKNSTSIPIIIWLDNQAFCSKTSDKTDCKQGDDSAWNKNLGKFYIFSEKDGQWVSSPGTPGRKQTLEPGQVWRIVPPVDEKKIPYWCFDQPAGENLWQRNCPGVGAWVTPAGLTMNAIEKVTRFEYNINTVPDHRAIYFNMSAVDGNNLNATMEYTGKDCPNNMRVCEVDLKTCPVQMIRADGALTCPSPKFWSNEEIDQCGTSGFGQKWNLSAKDLIGCGYGDDRVEQKTECHKWWATNKCGQKWLTYLQKNQVCESYGWAYDEMRWKPGDTFDRNGNPSHNEEVHTLMKCPLNVGPSSINMDITGIMH